MANSYNTKGLLFRTILSDKAKKWAKRILLGLFVFSNLWVLSYRWVNPPITWLMLHRKSQMDLPIQRKSIPLSQMGYFPQAVIAGEDQRFYMHSGFDGSAIFTAFVDNLKGKPKKGGSTVSQQTAKNLFLWHGRNYIRKALEAYFTFLMELYLPKERILHLYLNNIEMGRGVYGVNAAAHYYFKKPPGQLSKDETARIVSVFPLPLKWSVSKLNQRQSKKVRIIKRDMHKMPKPKK